MTESRAILFVGAGIETLPGIRRAQQLGLHVVASDVNPEAPGLGLAQDRLLASTYDIAATVIAARRFHQEVRPLAGVLCLGTDVPRTVAAVSAELGLPGISPEAARLAADKLAMKDCFAAAGVAVPWYAPVEDAGHLGRLCRQCGFPAVLKPVDSRGARGVLRLTETSDRAWAYQTSRAESPSGRVMLERYLDGPQVSTESLVIGGEAYTPGFSDRNYEFLQRFAPHIIENGGELPSHLPRDQQQAICELVGRAAAAMGIADGVVKGDIVVHRGVPHVIELAARLSGGYFCSHEIPLNTGVDFVGAAIRRCLGDPLDPAELTPRFQRGVAQRYLFPEPGRVVRIDVPEWITADPDIALCEIRTRIGADVAPAHNHPARAGVVIATGADRQAAVAKAEAAVAAINVVTEA